jgi:ATP dependent DNA ligase domain
VNGEAVWAGKDGRSDFEKLHSNAHDDQVFLYGFDLLELNGEDYRQYPLEKRKAKLEKILKRTQGMRFLPTSQTTLKSLQSPFFILELPAARNYRLYKNTVHPTVRTFVLNKHPLALSIS